MGFHFRAERITFRIFAQFKHIVMALCQRKKQTLIVKIVYVKAHTINVTVYSTLRSERVNNDMSASSKSSTKRSFSNAIIIVCLPNIALLN